MSRVSSCPRALRDLRALRAVRGLRDIRALKALRDLKTLRFDDLHKNQYFILKMTLLKKKPSNKNPRVCSADPSF